MEMHGIQKMYTWCIW